MSILKKESRPGDGPDSYYALDGKLLAGFVNPFVDLSHGKRKLAASKLRARIAAVDLWTAEGTRPSQSAIAKRLGVSPRCLAYQFPDQGELYAFPPPELAVSLTSVSTSRMWPEIADQLVPVFAQMNDNLQGRGLMSGLVRLHRCNRHLAETDGYFCFALRKVIREYRPRSSLPIAALFTDGLRLAFADWHDAGEPDLAFVSDRAGTLLVGAIQNAYEALQ